MATTSPNAPSWFKRQLPGLDAYYQNQKDKAAGIRVGGPRTFDTTKSVPASNQSGYGSGAAGASARRFLRSARGGVAAVMDKMQDEDRNSAMDREDAIRLEAWGRDDKRYDAAQQAQKSQSDAEYEFMKKIFPQQGDQAPQPVIPVAGSVTTNPPVGTITNPTTGVMTPPSTANITPGISENPTQVASPPIGGVTKIFSQYGKGNNAPVNPLLAQPLGSPTSVSNLATQAGAATSLFDKFGRKKI